MKKKFMLSVVFLAAISVALVSFKSKHQDENFQDGSPLVFWTANCNYGAIEIFVNNVYQGDITKCYNSAPECASSGCVTVIIKGSKNVWRAQTKDGRRKWESSQCRIPSDVCNSECLR